MILGEFFHISLHALQSDSCTPAKSSYFTNLLFFFDRRSDSLFQTTTFLGEKIGRCVMSVYEFLGFGGDFSAFLQELLLPEKSMGSS